MIDNYEIRDQIVTLTNALIKKYNHAYASGYLQSLLSSMITDHIPLEKRDEVIKEIKHHISSAERVEQC